ncbi:hypothetical protein GCM10011362_05030 [Marinobacter halophilus]|nr:hypothetical protein GCM10011362_05030 [Marinobacter halophilus]
MRSRDKITQPDAIPFRAMILFLVLTFGIAWGILAAFIFLPETMVGLFGEITGQHPLFYLAVWAALIIGVIWGLWHTPAFLLSGTEQSAWSFLPFFTGTIALSVIVTPLFNASRGSLFLPALFHFILINPVWPDAQPYDTYLFTLIAFVIVWLNRRTMFTRKYSITQVVPADRAAGASSGSPFWACRCKCGSELFPELPICPSKSPVVILSPVATAMLPWRKCARIAKTPPQLIAT